MNFSVEIFFSSPLFRSFHIQVVEICNKYNKRIYKYSFSIIFFLKLNKTQFMCFLIPCIWKRWFFFLSSLSICIWMLYFWRQFSVFFICLFFIKWLIELEMWCVSTFSCNTSNIIWLSKILNLIWSFLFLLFRHLQFNSHVCHRIFGCNSDTPVNAILQYIYTNHLFYMLWTLKLSSNVFVCCRYNFVDLIFSFFCFFCQRVNL